MGLHETQGRHNRSLGVRGGGSMKIKVGVGMGFSR